MSLRFVDVAPYELVVVKPAGLASEVPRDPGADSLVRRLAVEGYPEVRLVHRLDAPACGLMVVARVADAAAHYAQEIAAGRWQKWYVARVAAGPHDAVRLLGAHRAYLKVDGRSARVVRSGGKPSFLDVALVTPVPGAPNESHLLVQLHTGRFHQIRVMLAYAGAPLVGDVRYGSLPGSSMYLEQVIVACRSYKEGTWRAWLAPPHPDRMAWAPDLRAAIEARFDVILASHAGNTPAPPG